MLIRFTIEHRNRYVPSDSIWEDLAEIKILLDALRRLTLAKPLKKMILDSALWQVAFATGNTQRNSWAGGGAKRSSTRSVLRIERDHVYQRKTLLGELFSSSADLDGIIARVQCCVVVTADEHKRISKIDGEKKYRIAGITVYDMLYGTKVVPELEWKDQGRMSRAWGLVTVGGRIIERYVIYKEA
jgi:hypothetical protein